MGKVDGPHYLLSLDNSFCLMSCQSINIISARVCVEYVMLLGFTERKKIRVEIPSALKRLCVCLALQKGEGLGIGDLKGKM